MLTRFFRASAAAPGESPLDQFFGKPRFTRNVLLVGCFILFVLYNGERHLWTPDEPRFGQIVKEMLRDGNIFVLHLNGAPYSDKPPLYFYLSALTAIVVGRFRGETIAVPDEWMMRWPSMAAAAAGIFLVYWMGGLLLNRRAGFFAAAAMGLSWTYIWQGRSSQLDMLMCGFIYASMACWARGAFGPGPRTKWTLLFYVFAALATLSKGPPGFIIPFSAVAIYRAWETNGRRAAWSGVAWIGVALALTWLAGSQESGREAVVSPNVFLVIAGATIAVLIVGSIVLWRGVFKQVGWARHALGLAAFMILVFGWLIPAQLKAPPGFSEDQLLGQTLLRYFNPGAHVAPMYYYLEKIAANWLPLTLFLPAAVVAAWSRTTPMPLRVRRFAMSWLLFTFVFFSLSPGKRDQYILPAWPAIALLFGHLFDTVSRGWQRSPRWFSIPNGILAVALIVAGIAALMPGVWIELGKEKILKSVGETGLQAIRDMPLRLIAAPCLLGGVGLGIAVLRKDAMRGFVALGFTVQVAVMIVAMYLMPVVNRMKSGKEFCEAVQLAWRPGDEVAMWSGGQETYVYYGLYPAQEISIDAMSTFLARPGRQFAIVRRDQARRLKSTSELKTIAETEAGGRAVVCVMETMIPAAEGASSGAESSGAAITAPSGGGPSMRSVPSIGAID